MSDHIEFGLHDLPWQPLGSELVHVLRYYDCPQAGVLEQHGVKYLFQAIFDLPSGLGVWVYTCIADEDSEALAALSDGDDADDLADELSRDRSGQLAVVIGGRVAQVTETAGTGPDALVNAMRELARMMDEQARGFGEISQLVPA